MLKQDAKLLTCADDIYDTFKEEYFSAINPFALLPKASVNMEAILRKYGVSVGRHKIGEKKHLPKASADDAHGQIFGRLKSIFGGEGKEKPAEDKISEEKREQDVKALRKALDEERRALLSPEAYTIYDTLHYDTPTHPDEISLLGIGADAIVAELITMEVLGYVAFMPGGCYVKNEN